MPTPLAHTNYEELDLEIGWSLPLAKHLEDSLLGILILYRRTLRALEPVWGVRIGSFATGEEALQALHVAHASGDPYDFAILDYQMPGMDGAELARAIKADENICETVVVLLTSFRQRIDVRQKESGTIDASLVKPVRQSKLLNTLSPAWSKKH